MNLVQTVAITKLMKHYTIVSIEAHPHLSETLTVRTADVSSGHSFTFTIYPGGLFSEPGRPKRSRAA